jgi:hypothetical protein
MNPERPAIDKPLLYGSSGWDSEYIFNVRV